MPYHGTKLELCSSIVVTTLSPSRNSVSSEYITALIASVVLRYVAMVRRLGALSHWAKLSYDASKSSVVRWEASRLTAVHVLVIPSSALAEQCGKLPWAAGCSPRCW